MSKIGGYGVLSIEVSKAPEWIIWLVTPYCNLRCFHCYASIYGSDKQLGYKDIVRVLEDAFENGVEHINYTGGEPILRRDILDILEATVEIGLTTSLFTNSTLVNDTVASRISRLEIPIYTSLDAPCKSLFEEIRGVGSWDKTMHGIKTLKSHGVYLHINMTVTRLNYIVTSDTIRKALELGADSISIIPSMPSGRALENRMYVEKREFLEALSQAEETAREYGVEIAVWCTPYIPLLEWARHLHSGNCRYWNVMDLAPNGDVLLCDVLGVRVSNVLVDGVDGAWRKLLEHPVMKKTMDIPVECSGCSIASYCRGGCFARSYIVRGGVDRRDPLCPVDRDRFGNI
mgnify:CR=1 FL=1